LPQDIVFGSEGTAQADFERMAEINHEIGLTQILGGAHGGHHGSGSDLDQDEKRDAAATSTTSPAAAPAYRETPTAAADPAVNTNNPHNQETV
jgi:surface antigen